MQDITNENFKWTHAIIEANFYFSLAILVFGCAISLSDSYSLFDFKTDLYGELANNLRIMMIYLAITDTLIYGFCSVLKQFHYFVVTGFFLIVTIASLNIYGYVNNVETDPNLDIFLLYTGISHMLFGAMHFKNKKPLL